jgi:hypothetical protein
MKRPRNNEFSKDELMTMIYEIRTYTGTLKAREERARKTHPSFAEHYPMLMEMALDELVPMERIRRILRCDPCLA